MEKLLGILPYIYLDEPIQLGDVKFVGIPGLQGRNHTPTTESDKRYLQELSSCFSTTRGLMTTKGGIRTLTYFLLENAKGKETEILEMARKAVTLLRYSLLRPDTQALDNIESTYTYTFTLPPEGNEESHIYRCWPNLNPEKEIWVSALNAEFPLPDSSVDLKLIGVSNLEDFQELKQQFYKNRLPGKKEADILLAMEWYNQSYLRYSLRDISGRLVDIATGFETLFQLPRNNKTAEFKKHIREYLGVKEGSLLDNWANDFYSNVRSETVHRGRPISVLFKHPEAHTPHLSFLWSSQCIFRECISIKAGLPRHISNDRLLDDLVPNEVHLDELRKAGSFKKILVEKMFGEIEKLKAIYPAGNREDIIWLGKELLKGYKELHKPSMELLPTMEVILNSGDIGTDLGLRYYQFLKEFEHIYPYAYLTAERDEPSKEETKKLKVITRAKIKQVQLESTIYGFVKFAGWALLMPP